MNIMQNPEINDPLVSDLVMDPLPEKIDTQLNHSHPNKVSPDRKNSNELSIFSNFENENNANFSISNLEDKKALSPIPENRQDESKILQEELFPPAPINESDQKLIVEVQIESPTNQPEQPAKNGEKEDDVMSEAEAQDLEILCNIIESDKFPEQKQTPINQEIVEKKPKTNSGSQDLLLTFQKEIAMLSEQKLIEEINKEKLEEEKTREKLEEEKKREKLEEKKKREKLEEEKNVELESCYHKSLMENSKNKDFPDNMENMPKQDKNIEEQVDLVQEQALKNNIEFNFKVIKCPNHFKEDIIFICNAPDCPMKFICSKCLVDDLKHQTRHHITHEQYFISYDENVFKVEYEKFLVKKNNFDKILEDQDYLLLKQIENGDISSIIQKKYQNEVNEIETFVASATAKTEDILSQYKGMIKDNVAQETKSFVKSMLEKFVCLKDEFHGKTEKLVEMQQKSKEIFSKTEEEGANEKVNLFLSLHHENQEEILCQKFNAFMQYSIKTLKEYTSKESNRPLKYEFYVNLMNTLKAMINEKIPKNLLNSNFSLLLKTKVNHLIKEDESKKSEKGADILFLDKNQTKLSVPQKPSTNNISNKASPNDNQNGAQKPPINITTPIIDVIDYYKNQVEILSSKNSHNIDYSMVLDICLIGPTDKKEYFVATCCSREKFIKIWTFSKERPPMEYRSLEGHNKSTYKLFYCHEKKWLLSAGFYPLFYCFIFLHFGIFICFVIFNYFRNGWQC